MFNSLNHIDWGLLHRQKQILVTMRAALPDQSSEFEALSGIVHLLDALQDDAVADGRWRFLNESDEDPPCPCNDPAVSVLKGSAWSLQLV